MIDITDKIETLRTAIAESQIHAKAESLDRVMRGDTPKGEVLNVARLSGIMAAKKTSDLIPYCHPLNLEHVDIGFERNKSSLKIFATVKTIGKTGVEMEALTAASVTALTVYDLMKAFDKEVIIGETKLIEKSGGKSDFRQKVAKDFRAAVIVTSDGTHQQKREDTSGKVLKEQLKKINIENVEYCILPDEKDKVRDQLLAYTKAGIDLILTTGGTGLGPRDVTVEATREVIQREMPAVMQAIRDFGQKRTPYAMLSRGLAGLRGSTVIVNLPGSSRGAKESMDAVFPALLHVYPMLKGRGH